MAAKPRLDQELVSRGLFPSREKAQRAIIAGEIWVNEQRWDKPSTPCPPEVKIEWRGADPFVSRGAYKLQAALDHFKIDPQGMTCLDIGSSTGGFTDLLLQRGAVKMVAIDVGKGQLHWKLRQDPRVNLREGVNARTLDKKDFPEPFPLIVTDVSFISLRLVLPPAFDLLSRPGKICALIKPQFEVGKDQVGKGGIVREESLREAVIADLKLWLQDFPVQTVDVIPSPILGREGNQEYLWCIEKL